jgi:choloylglycine hydrolase
MCTAIHIKEANLFGRNLDLDYNFGGTILFIPRNFPLKFKKIKTNNNHYAILGTGVLFENIPLFADGINEKGLCIAGLNFDGYAQFNKYKDEKINLGSFEIISYILANFKTAYEVCEFIKDLNILDIDFSKQVKSATLHWIVADKKESYVIESTKDGLKVYKNIYGVLTNNPNFQYHLENVKNYLNVTNQNISSRFSNNFDITPLSKGSGTFSLPGDYTSPSRFIKAAFLVNNFYPKSNRIDNVINAFDILKNVSFVRGAVISNNSQFELTYYSAIMDQNELVYYVNTLFNHRITAINFCSFDLNTSEVQIIDLPNEQDINFIN